MLGWSEFEQINPDKNTAFEMMCRFLFRHKLCPPNTILQSDPNNPGVEVHPVVGLDKSRISFQAKFFPGSIQYADVLDSCKKIVKYYRNELDKVYFYCNKDFTRTSASFLSCKSVLENAGIELLVITNQELLQQIEEDPIVMNRYFGKYCLDFEWFKRQSANATSNLGRRYNSEFNVITETEKKVAVFCDSVSAHKRYIERIEASISKIDHYYGSHEHELLARLRKDLGAILDTPPTTVQGFIKIYSTYRSIYCEEYDSLRSKRDELINKRFTSNPSSEERDEISSAISDIERVMAIFSSLILDETDVLLSNAKVLLIQGDAGVGKSQMFAHAVNELISLGIPSIFLSGNRFINNDDAYSQIINLLQLNNITFPSFLDALECIGEELSHPVVVFIDAINESFSNGTWANGIPQIVEVLEKYHYIRFAFSFRTGFEKQLYFEDTWIQSKPEIVQLRHTGFTENRTTAIRAFFDYYGIPFSPSFYFKSEMKNPLYLLLFCEVNDGTDTDMPSLFEKLLKKVDLEARKAINLTEAPDLIFDFVEEFVSKLLERSTWFVEKKDLLNFNFWNRNGISNKWSYISALVDGNVLIDNVKDDTIHYYFSYNLLQDYLVAKEVVRQHNCIESILEWATKRLSIEDGTIKKYGECDCIIAVSEICYEQFGKDIVPYILDLLRDSNDVSYLCDKYIQSYAWRKNKNVDRELFLNLANKYGIAPRIVFPVLIDNSIKPTSPLNAEFLDEILWRQTMVMRDQIWTSYINSSFTKEERITQLIESLLTGENVLDLSDKQLKLLLILFGWHLTSSNRVLRDKCSKAMIEVLKNHFQYCLFVLQHFEKVNDPYVIQRLYGIVFGAVMKRRTQEPEEFTKIADFAYHSIFMADEVYPDILLRDYARLILERWLLENPNQGIIDKEIIHPPYNYPDLPRMEEADYCDSKKYSSAIIDIAWSMLPNCTSSGGAYGDFGRYVFQAAVSKFEGVDIRNTYLFAMDYIINQIGYDNRFRERSSRRINYNRHDTRKCERIGKKYQWIAMYHTLARISDNHNLDASQSDGDGINNQFKGAWNPYVRDFDPTLSSSFMNNPQAPSKMLGELHNVEFLDDFYSSDCSIVEWANKPIPFFDIQYNKLVLQDTDGVNWVLLNNSQTDRMNEAKTSEFRSGERSQIIWRQANAFFIEEDQFERFMEFCVEPNFDIRELPKNGNQYYQMFNREYYWSPAFDECRANEQMICEVDSGEYEEIEYPSYSSLWANLTLPTFIELDDESSGSENCDETDSLASVPILLQDEFAKQDEDSRTEICSNTTKIPIKKEIGTVLTASNDFLWESEYDASMDNSISFSIPCSELTSFFSLQQKTFDGYFYDNDILVAFDRSLAGDGDGLVCRQDYLLKFIEAKKYVLLWAVSGEKQFIKGFGNQIWSEWDGLFYWSENGIKGSLSLSKPASMPQTGK